jgi:hypothetical protein
MTSRRPKVWHSDTHMLGTAFGHMRLGVRQRSLRSCRHNQWALPTIAESRHESGEGKGRRSLPSCAVLDLTTSTYLLMPDDERPWSHDARGGITPRSGLGGLRSLPRRTLPLERNIANVLTAELADIDKPPGGERIWESQTPKKGGLRQPRGAKLRGPEKHHARLRSRRFKRASSRH